MEGNTPLKGASALARFPGAEQAFLAATVLAKAHFTTNQLVLISGWLFDLKKIRGEGVREILKSAEIQRVLQHPKMDLRTRGERLFTLIRALRYPRLSAADKNFKRLI